MYTGHFDASLALPLESLPAQLPASPRKRGVAPSSAQRQPPPARPGKKKKRRQAATSSSLVGLDASQRDLVGPSAVHASAQQAQPAPKSPGPTHVCRSIRVQQQPCSADTNGVCQPPAGKLARLNRPMTPGKRCISRTAKTLFDISQATSNQMVHIATAWPWQ